MRNPEGTCAGSACGLWAVLVLSFVVLLAAAGCVRVGSGEDSGSSAAFSASASAGAASVAADASASAEDSGVSDDSAGSVASSEQGAALVVESDEGLYDGAAYEAGHVLVVPSPDVSADEVVGALEQQTGRSGFAVEDLPSGDWRVELPDGVSVADALEALGASGLSVEGQPNFVYETEADETSRASLVAAPLPVGALGAQSDAGAVNDPLASEQWAIEAMNLQAAWALALDAKAVSDTPGKVNRTVAVIDEGFLAQHEDLKAAVVDTYNSYNASTGVTSSSKLKDVSPIQQDGHGTYVAGIVGACANNGKGIAGVSYNAQLQLVKAAVANDSGTASFTSASLAEGINHAVGTASAYNTRVINLSVGGKANSLADFDTVLTKAIDTAFENGVVVVASSGNSSSSAQVPYLNYPSDYGVVVSVISLQNRKNGADAYARSATSNYNMSDDDWGKDISAPGVEICSLDYRGAYGYQGGTSMAAPQVAGVLSLVFAANPSLSSQEAVDLLYATATDLNKGENRKKTTFDSETGYGLVNAYAAVKAALEARGAATSQEAQDAKESQDASGDAAEQQASQEEGQQEGKADGSSGSSGSSEESGGSAKEAGGSDASGKSDEASVREAEKAAVPQVGRICGETALDTMLQIVRKGGWQPGGTVVLVTADGYWDGLTANGVAGLAGAPIVMTSSRTLSTQARKAISSLKPARIIVCGGTAAVTDAVAKAACDAAGTSPALVRLWGAQADDTAVSIFEKGASSTGGSWSSCAFVCTDDGYWDALSAAPVSYANHMPIFLTRGSGASLSAQTLAAMKKGGVTGVYIVGGKGAVSAAVESQLKSAGIAVSGRIWGKDAVATSGEVARFGLEQGLSVTDLGVATTTGYWDALAGAAYCGRAGSVLVVVDGPKASSVSGFVKSHRASVGRVTIFGGTEAVSSATESALRSALG